MGTMSGRRETPRLLTMVACTLALGACSLDTSSEDGGEGRDGADAGGSLEGGGGGSGEADGGGAPTPDGDAADRPDAGERPTRDAGGPVPDAASGDPDAGASTPDATPPRPDAGGDCEPGATLIQRCGLNDRGQRRAECGPDGIFGEPGACEDPDVCIDDSRQTEPCGDDGQRSRDCVAGQWSE